MSIASGLTDRVIHAALNGLSARQRVAADNIANVDTPGFAASRVEFEQVLRSAVGQGSEPVLLPIGDGPMSSVSRDPLAVQPRVVASEGVRRHDGNNVDIDQEMVRLADTTITYNALAQLTAGRLQLLRTIVNDGRR